MLRIACDKIRIAHAEEMFVFDLSCIFSRDLLDVLVSNIACFTLMIVEEHVDIFTIIDCRNHQLTGKLGVSSSFIIILDLAILLLTIRWTQNIMPYMHGKDRVRHYRDKSVPL